MAVLINDNGMLGLRESYSPINTNFSNHGELFVLTNWLEERLKYTMFSADIIGKKMTFQYLEGREFAIVDKKNGLGFFPPFTMVRVVFPLDEFAKLKDKIREEYGESDMRNVLHSSDSYKNFTHESQIYFYNVNQEDLLQQKRNS